MRACNRPQRSLPPAKDFGREMPDGGLPRQGVARGERHTQKPVDKLLETHAQVLRLTFLKPSGNIWL